MPAPPSVHLNLITKWLPVMVSPGGLLLGILGRDVPPGSPNLDPIRDQK